MKSINDDNNGGDNHSLLGFSLSNPQTQYNHHTPLSNTPPTSSFFLSPSQFNNNSGGVFYGGLHSALSVMPLKSDGSLCIMEALTKSQPEGIVSNSSPKLEDFLGGASMGTHYEPHEREAMALSLDSIYYNLNIEPEAERHVVPVHSQPFYSGLIPCSGIYQTHFEEQEGEAKDTRVSSNCDSQIPQFSNWVARQYSNHTMEQQLDDNMVDENGGSGSVSTMGCGDLQSLTLSMSPGSQSSCVTAPRQISPTGLECAAMETKKRGLGKAGLKQPVHRKSIDTFGQRTSQYRGVTRHRWTGRYEAHLWDNSCKKEGQTRKGRQVYLGGYDMEEKAARAYDLAALKYWGPSTHINFSLDNYQTQLEEMKNMSRQEYVAHLRRKSSGFSRGASMYRGVTRHHQHGRWQARIGRVAGNKDLYLGTFSTQEEAAEAYDIAAIKFRGVNAVTNFDISRYDVERIMASNTLLAVELARKNNKDISQQPNNSLDYSSNPSMLQNNTEISPSDTINANDSNLKMVFRSPQVETIDNNNNKSMTSKNYRNVPFSMSLQDLIGIDSMNSSNQAFDESGKHGIHFTNPSLMTSMIGSRDASPDKIVPTIPFTSKPPLESKFVGHTSGVSSWFSSSQVRPSALAMSHLPVFAAWNDT